MSSASKANKPAAKANPQSVDEVVELAKRAFALKKYEEAVEHYATALELATAKYGSSQAQETADLWFSYGRALLENAITQSSVLGKDGGQEDLPGEGDEDASKRGAFLSFSGDAEEGDESAVDIFAEAAKGADAEDEHNEEEEEEDEEAEPEDDFNAAWEALEVARSLFEKKQDEDDQIKLKLADTFTFLGDVSLETEKFEQAIGDYSSALELKTELLPVSSRHITDLHFKLCIVLDLTSGRLSDSIIHAEKALESVEARLAELRNARDGQMKVETLQTADPKGKGKAPAKGPRILGADAVQNMTQAEIETEIKEMEGMREDIALKVEELKTIPNEPHESAPALAAKALDQELNAGTAPAAAPLPVNDLTSIVKKKKKPVVETTEMNGESTSATKRKAEDDAESPSDKKARLEDAPIQDNEAVTS